MSNFAKDNQYYIAIYSYMPIITVHCSFTCYHQHPRLPKKGKRYKSWSELVSS